MAHPLHYSENHELYALKAEVRDAVNKLLENSPIYQRIESYLKLANDNIEKVSNQIKHNNYWYEEANNFKFNFDKTAFLHSGYEIELSYKIDNRYKSTKIGLDSFIILLSECGLVKDE